VSLIVDGHARQRANRESGGGLGEIYGVEVSRDLISRVTEHVAGELAAWQSRPLDSTYTRCC
jgi:putative transposase